MSYITQADVEGEFGTANIAKWSQLDNTVATADTTRIAAAIAYAEREIDNRFRTSRYSVPLTGDGATLYEVKRWAQVLAGVWLYANRGTHDENTEADAYQAKVDGVHAEIDSVLAGQRAIPALLKYSDAPTGPVIV